MKNPKPVLVTGATGCIGRMLVKRLSEAGQSVRALVRNPDRAADLCRLPNVELVFGDLSRPDSLRGCAEGCSKVFHCAAILLSSNWEESQAINVSGTRAVVDEVIRAGVERLVYTSTVGVYGLCKDEVINEETPWAKYHQPYFTTKQEAERIVWRAAGRIPLTIARVGDVIGPGQYTWTIDLILKSKRGLLTSPFKSEAGFLNPVYIDNLLEALLLMSEHPAAIGQIFNVVDGAPIRIGDFFRRIGRMDGKKIISLPAFVMKSVAIVLSSVDRLRGRVASVTPGGVDYLLRKGRIYPNKLHSLLGWTASIPPEEAFRQTEQWLRQEGYCSPA